MTMEINVVKLRSEIISSPEKSKLVYKNDMSMHQIIGKESNSTDPPCKIFDVWPSSVNDTETVNLILLGETGKGKSTLIDGILNFLLGVNCSHVFRMLVPTDSETANKSDSDSQTEEITVYRFPYANGMPYKRNFEIIDTPGLLDTRGNEVQKENLRKINTFLENYYYKETLYIGIVTESHLNHGSKVDTIVGELNTIILQQPNVKIISIATFAERSEPTCYSALDKMNLTLDQKIKINNSVIFSNPLSGNAHLGEEWETWDKQMATLLGYLTQESNRTRESDARTYINHTPEMPLNSSDEESGYFSRSSSIRSSGTSISSSGSLSLSRSSSMRSSNSGGSSFVTAKSNFSMDEIISNFKHTNRQNYEIFKDSVDAAVNLAVQIYKLKLDWRPKEETFIEKHSKGKQEALELFKACTNNLEKKFPYLWQLSVEDLDCKMETILKNSNSNDSDSAFTIQENQASGLPGQSGGTKDSKVESSDDNDFAKAVLIETNAKRKIHCVDKLTLNEEMCKFAKEWAMKMAKDNQISHRPDGKYGENVLCVSSNSKEFEVEAKTVVDNWYSKSKDHAFGKDSEGTTLKAGYFTHMIWKDSKQMGVGKARSASGLKVFVVAYFDPAGNWRGQFVKQVPPVGGFPKKSKYSRRRT